MIVAIANPAAGNGHAAKISREIEGLLQKAGVAYRMQYTQYPGHGTELAKAAAEAGAETVLSIGGDGTAFEVCCGLLYSETALGIIPAGTGNDYIKSLHLPKDPAAALRFILSGRPRSVDVGTINEKVFMNVCGTGFDVSVLDYAEPAKKYCKGMLPYLWGLIRTVLHFEPVHVTLIADGRELFSKDILVCAVANGRYIGGGMPIAPEAQVDDGLFDVVVVDLVSRWKILRYLPKFFSGKVLEVREATLYRAKEVVLRAAHMRVQEDGEIFPMTEARFRLPPDAIRLYW